MARYIGNKNRIARRFGANIFGRARNPLLHKPNPPGVHEQDAVKNRIMVCSLKRNKS
ncbi:MAG TPA: hypothetical protein PLC42_02840 [Parachlamydiaceae bacterium]|nr:hypothetical protein [Parachlamydiaceae bacterium]